RGSNCVRRATLQSTNHHSVLSLSSPVQPGAGLVPIAGRGIHSTHGSQKQRPPPSSTIQVPQHALPEATEWPCCSSRNLTRLPSITKPISEQNLYPKAGLAAEVLLKRVRDYLDPLYPQISRFGIP